MKTDPATGVLVPFDFRGIYDEFPAIRSLQVRIDVQSLTPVIDSSNVTPALWLHLAELIRDNYARYDGFVVLHGTDTVSYTHLLPASTASAKTRSSGISATPIRRNSR